MVDSRKLFPRRQPSIFVSASTAFFLSSAKGLAAAGDGVLFYRQTVNEECLESVSAWLEVEFDQVFLLHNLSEFLALVLNG